MDSFARYPSRSYTVMPDGLLVELIERKVGRNGWAVMAALSHRIYDVTANLESTGSACGVKMDGFSVEGVR